MTITLLRVLRQINNKTLQELSEAVGISGQRLSLIELNRADASLEQRRAIASYFGAPAEKILTRIDDATLADVTAFAVGRAS